jgi:hypothetical protein
VNEVVIGLKDKNKFNSSEPKDDATNFADYVTNPTLPELLEIIFPTIVMAPTRFPRTDLLAAFALGLSGVNDTGQTPSEMIRLNTTSAGPFAPRAAPQQQSFGAATCLTGTMTDDATVDAALPGCDPTGFPNGRRPGDDVVDIELRVAMGRLLKDADAPFLPKAILVDGATTGPLTTTGAVTSMATNFGNAFPYLNTPIGGSPGGS